MIIFRLMLKQYPHIGIIILLFFQLILAIQIYTDFGLHWDDYSTRVIGANNALLANQRLNYVFASESTIENLVNRKVEQEDRSRYKELDSLENYELSQYGPFFELVLIGVDSFWDLKAFMIFSIRDILLCTCFF